MTPAAPAFAPTPPAMFDSAVFDHVAALLEQRTGQRVQEGRAWRVEIALQSLMRGEGLHDPGQLMDRLSADHDGSFAARIIDALLNQETSFFRDAQMFDHVRDALGTRAREAGRRLRIWSAGCSTGQEPLSLAMLCAEIGMEDAAMPDLIATDVSAHAVARARAGRYSSFEVQRGLPVRRLITWFAQDGEEWVASPALMRSVRYLRHNLVFDVPPPGGFDMILCRNVLFYFPAEVRRDVFERLANALRPGGWLVLGAGETMVGQRDLFEPCARYRGFYCRGTGESAV